MRFKGRTYAVIAGLLLLLFAISLSACAGEEEKKESETTHSVNNERETFPPAYVPHNHVDFNNFNKAQKLYDTPSTIVWCTTAWANPSAPMVTVPIAGKLTSSSVSYLPQDKVEWDSNGNVVRENFSNDGMFHGNPPPYRYGFTPGGQYMDYFNMEAICTTALTEFQRKKTEVTIAVNPTAKKATEEAEKVLAEGTDPTTKKISPKAEAEAQRILLEANLNG
jgi:hypothetical protein